MALTSNPNSPAASLYLIPTIALALLFYYGAFSRLTHGRFTPQFHAYQTDHLPEDSSAVAPILPYIDLLLGGLLLLPNRTTRVTATGIFTIMQGIGLLVQVQAGKSWGLDVLLLAFGFGVLQALRAQ